MRTQLVGAGFVLAVAVVTAQQPVRDARPAPAVGRGVVSGIALTGDPDPRPLRGAHVTLIGAELLGGRIVITDASGVFRFTGLPPGRFTLSASKPAYLTANYGAKRPGGPGVALALADGGALTDLKLTLPKGGVIAGRLVDERGRPQPAADVGAMRYSWSSGERQLSPTKSAVTDDRGEYRIFGLLPGEYAVRANRGAGGGDIHPIAPGEIEAALNPQRSAAPAPPPSEATFGFSPVYYPGTTVAADARMISVAVGEEIGGVDFALTSVPTARVAGAIVGSAIPAGQVQVRLFGGGVRTGLATDVIAQPGGQSVFRFSGVAPGHYTVMAWTSGPGGSAAGATEWASAEVDVNGRHIDGIELRLRPGFTVSGRVVFEDPGAEPPPSGWMVGLISVLSATEASVAGTPAPIAADGSFTIRGVTPARYRVNASSRTPADASGRAWVPKSVTVNGADVLNVPADLRSGSDLTDIVVTLTTQRTELSGTLQSAAGDPAPAFFVIAFPTNRAYWTNYSRHIRAIRPGTDGMFRFVGLPSGEYYMAALTDVEQGEWLDPAFLERLVPSAFKITLAEGEKKTQDIRIAK